MNTRGMADTVKINKYMPVVLLYFFFNSFLLPTGLLYTTLLTPFFLLWLYQRGAIRFIWPFFVFALPFVVAHLLNGVNALFYFKSFLLLFSAYVFGATVYQFLKDCHSLPYIYKNIVLTNMVLVLLVVLLALIFPSLKSSFWYSNEITTGVRRVRLKMFTYEPSYYSTLLVPVAVYYYLKSIIFKPGGAATTLIFLTIPLLLSLSFGIIFGLLIAVVLAILWFGRNIFVNRNVPAYFILGSVALFLLLGAFLQIFPGNVFAVRIANVLSGKDTSFKGRTFDSFHLAWQIAAKKSMLFGCGPGQVKLLGVDLFKSFYKNPHYSINDVGIPNAVGDTLATFGVAGIITRFFLQFYFFFKTAVYNNMYRLCLFLFIFIYQFTGSFITNIAEYVIWILAFSVQVFPEFNKAALTTYIRAQSVRRVKVENSINPQ